MFLIRRKHSKARIIFKLKRRQIRLSFWQLLHRPEMQESLETGDFGKFKIATLKSVDESRVQKYLGSKGELVGAGGPYVPTFLPASPYAGAAWAGRTAASSTSIARTKTEVLRCILPESHLDLSSILTALCLTLHKSSALPAATGNEAQHLCWLFGEMGLVQTEVREAAACRTRKIKATSLPLKHNAKI